MENLSKIAPETASSRNRAARASGEAPGVDLGIIWGSFWVQFGDHLGISLVSFRDHVGIILGYFGIWEGFYSREVGVIRFNLHPLINHPPCWSAAFDSS